MYPKKIYKYRFTDYQQLSMEEISAEVLSYLNKLNRIQQLPVTIDRLNTAMGMFMHIVEAAKALKVLDPDLVKSKELENEMKHILKNLKINPNDTSNDNE